MLWLTAGCERETAGSVSRRRMYGWRQCGVLRSGEGRARAMVMQLVARLKRMQALGVVVAFLLLVSAGFAILSAAGNGRPGSSGRPARQTSTAQSTASTRPAPATTTTTLASAGEAGNEGGP